MKIIAEGIEIEGIYSTEEALRNLESIAKKAISDEGIDETRCEVSLTFLCPEEMRELNRAYRGVDNATDVLSFPQYNPEEQLPEEGPLLLGDVIICPDICKKQAEDYCHSEEREYYYLFVHSMLHLLGYDHIDGNDKKRMRQVEENILMEVMGEL